jgi:ATP-dependent DNA helicase RecQ
VPREDDKTINRHSTSIKKYLELQQVKAKRLIQFIRNDEVCRSQQVLSYFGESFEEPCGMCDVCIQKKRSKQNDDISKDLIALFKANDKLSKEEIFTQVDAAEDTILIHLRNLLRRDIIDITTDSKLYLK